MFTKGIIFILLVSVLILLSMTTWIFTMIRTQHEGFLSKPYYDPSLQYNIVNHPYKNKILSAYTSTVQSGPPFPSTNDIETQRKRIQEWYDTTQQKGKLRPMDMWAKISIEAALDSISMGNWGIGNVLVYMPKGTEDDPTQWVEILRGGNRFFTRNTQNILSTQTPIPRFDSHGHGEMIVLDAFEDQLSKGMFDKTSPSYVFDKRTSPIDFRKKSNALGYSIPDGIVLFTQLNSCQMCLSRIGNAGISRCYWIAPDTGGGMAHRLCDSVPAYFNMLNRQLHTVADVSPELIQFAFDAFAGPEGAWVNYCVWKLNELAAPQNAKMDYKYCRGQWYANTKVGQNAEYDWRGWTITVPKEGGPVLDCTITPPSLTPVPVRETSGRIDQGHISSLGRVR